MLKLNITETKTCGKHKIRNKTFHLKYSCQYKMNIEVIQIMNDQPFPPTPHNNVKVRI